MPLEVPPGAPMLLIRVSAFEAAGLTRAVLDTQFHLADDEFRVEGGLIAIGPFHGDTALTDAVVMFEKLGLTYYEDFFELSGNWPTWLRLFAMKER